MVQIRNTAPRLEDGQIDIEAWLETIYHQRGQSAVQTINNAYSLAALTGGNQKTFTGQTCLQQGLEMAEILLDLHCDYETVAASLIYCCVQFAGLTREDIEDGLGKTIATLTRGVEQMDVLHSLHAQAPNKEDSRNQIDKLRKMMLAMAQDVRVVFIKLAERACVLRHIKDQPPERSRYIGQEILDIYAPLANRLGIGQLKWEMEDLSFRYCQPEIYKTIATQLQERRLDREAYVQTMIKTLEQMLQQLGITKAQVQGRAKHIYSIYRKMQRKQVDLSQIYDATAVRILVPELEECYAVLGAVHNAWQHLPQEFDDYVTTPKENGYQSIHTAVYGPDNKVVEVQIRTFTMHEESELGVAAHWMYKEGRAQTSSYQDKITWLRQIIAWQKEMAQDSQARLNVSREMTEDRVYVITPAGDVMELPQGATPLDFAYQIHSEIGHRCRGAKVNGRIVPLTYRLQTADVVEILTQKHPKPSRDWLNADSGYLISARAKAKIHHWFKQQDYDTHVAIGQQALQEELKRQHLHWTDFQSLAVQLKFKSSQDLFASLGNHTLKTGQVITVVQEKIKQQALEKAAETEIQALPTERFTRNMPSNSSKKGLHDLQIDGADDLLTHIAQCCKPLPGEKVQGYITKGRGISVHRTDCKNLQQLSESEQARLVEVNWGEQTQQAYSVDIHIEAIHRRELIREVTAMLSQEKIAILALNSRYHRSTNTDTIVLTLELDHLNTLQPLFERLKQIDSITRVTREFG